MYMVQCGASLIRCNNYLKEASMRSRHVCVLTTAESRAKTWCLSPTVAPGTVHSKAQVMVALLFNSV